MFSRRSFLSLALAVPARPNVVVFLADDMGYADLGSYGAKDIRTPHLDRLAREGVRLTDCYSNGPVCTPTRCALLTGRYQQRYGRALEWALVPVDVNQGLLPHHTTIARLLKNAGYRTALYGKWHLGREPQFNPLHHGFDEFFGLTGGNVDMYSKQDRFDTYDLYEGLNQAPSSTGYLTDLLAARAVQFIDAHRAQPFFLYVPFNAVHWPFQAPNQPASQRNAKTWTDGARSTEYKPMLEAMDSAVGRVLQALDRHGLSRNTLVLFTNDNGGERLSDNGPFRHHKATLWEGGIRVPALLRWPAKLPKGKVSHQVAISMDFAATISAACGLPANPVEPFDGIDLTPILTGAQPLRDRDLFWRINRPRQRVRAVRSGPWKYVLDGGIHNLYNLSTDPGETRDLFAIETAVAGKLQQKLAAWEKSLA